MTRDPIVLLARFGAFPVAVLVAGIVWALVEVFVLGHWEPKFGRGGSLQIHVVLVGAVAGVGLLVNGLLALLSGRWTSGWPAHRHALVGIGGGLVTIVVLATGAFVPLVKWLPDVLGDEIAALLVACALVQAVVLAAGTLAAGIGRR